MAEPLTSYERFAKASFDHRRLLGQEELILEVTEALVEALEHRRITRTELARRLGKSRGFVSQLLGGGRNLTLRTVAEVADALGMRVRIRLEEAVRRRGRAAAAGAGTWSQGIAGAGLVAEARTRIRRRSWAGKAGAKGRSRRS